MQGKSYVRLDSARYTKLPVRFWQTLPRLCSQALHLCAAFIQEQAEIASLTSKIADIQLTSRAHGQIWNLTLGNALPPWLHSAPLIYASQSFPTWPSISPSSTKPDDHLEVCLRLATSTYCLDYASLAYSIQSKSSEWGRGHKIYTELYCAKWVYAVMQGKQTCTYK